MDEIQWEGDDKKEEEEEEFGSGWRMDSLVQIQRSLCRRPRTRGCGGRISRGSQRRAGGARTEPRFCVRVLLRTYVSPSTTCSAHGRVRADSAIDPWSARWLWQQRDSLVERGGGSKTCGYFAWVDT